MKTLIIYTTKSGTTKDCADILSGMLEGGTAIIDLKHNPNVDISGYSTIIIGTPLYMGKIMKPVKRFCDKNISVLMQKKIAFYTCGLAEASEAEKYFNSAIPETLISHAAARGFFGAELRLDKMNFLMRFAMKKMQEDKKINPEIDKEAIREFSMALNKIR